MVNFVAKNKMMKGLTVAWLVMGLFGAYGQTLTGTWQVVKDSNCMGQEFEETSDVEDELLENMSSRAGATSKVFLFNTDGSGEKTWHSKGKKKGSSKEKFLFKENDGILYFLDKKSSLIVSTFLIEELTSTTLIMFNKDRSCERLELARVK